MSAITLNVDDRGVATVLVDHPPINLMTAAVFVELAKLTSRLATDNEVRVVILRSANPEWFIAHFDVEAILGFPTDTAPPAELPGFHLMCETFRTMPKPTIAVIEGRVGGGGNEIAMSCDMRFATQQAVFNQPEVALGIIPGIVLVTTLGGGIVELLGDRRLRLPLILALVAFGTFRRLRRRANAQPTA